MQSRNYEMSLKEKTICLAIMGRSPNCCIR